MQQSDSKDGGTMEDAAQEAENITDVPNGDFQAEWEDFAPTDGQNPCENGNSADGTAAGRPDSAENVGSGGEKLSPQGNLEQKIAELEAQVADYRDQLLRKAADVENFRKRMNQEKQNAIDFANQSLLYDIIPIIDDFERGLQSAQSSAELAELPAGKLMLDGLAMIERRLVSRLEGKWGLRRFDSAGEPFDPNRHEAMMMEKSPDVEEPVVKEEYLKGYMLKDRVIRAAQVKVVMPED